VRATGRGDGVRRFEESLVVTSRPVALQVPAGRREDAGVGRVQRMNGRRLQGTRRPVKDAIRSRQDRRVEDRPDEGSLVE